MTVGKLIEVLQKFDPEMDVITQKTDFVGNVGEVFSVKESSYKFFGRDIPCILLTDECENNNNEGDDE